MAREKKEDPPKGAPAWQSTFSDLMNLLLCFFVLLFSMSTVDAEKMQMVIQSFENTFSVLPSGGSTVSTVDGALISTGVSALEQFDVYFNASTAEKGDQQNQGNNADSQQANTGSEGVASGINDGTSVDNNFAEKYEAAELSDSEKMAEEIEAKIEAYGMQDLVEVDFNAQFVLITLNGALLFDSGQSDVRDDAYPIIDKLGAILTGYNNNLIEIEGHTDNVPIKSSSYEDNNVLSMYRAYHVADYLRSTTSINPGHIISSGRGEYDPVADNSSAEGRAKNRRVEIKVYNSYNSGEVE